MTQRHNSSAGTIVCSTHDSRRCSSVRGSVANDHNMLACRNISISSDQSLFPSFATQTPFTLPFTSGTDFCAPSQANAFSPLRDVSQYTGHQHGGYLQSFTDLPYCTRTSFDINSYNGTMEPQMMHNQHTFPRHFEMIPRTQPSFSMADTTLPNLFGVTGPTIFQSGMLSFDPRMTEYCQPPEWQQTLPIFEDVEYEPTPPTDSDAIITGEEETGHYDKPYAQLIYEALMQAPGHRMLLRDIYEWFQKNTKKPRESGTNGWQNSIRHNLSMNQAFENDKNDPAASRGVRKANSVWVLTDYAIRHGVQSTTRYRKNGSVKKATLNRTPAVQRQRSGAKGGRAARRAALVKRQEVQQYAPYYSSTTESPIPYSHSASPLSTARDQWSTYSESPMTPTDDHFPHAMYGLPTHPNYYEHELETYKNENDDTAFEEEQMRQILAASQLRYSMEH